MADDEDDYLSDKFLALSEAASSKPSTYAEKRKQAQKASQLKNEQNRLKTRRMRELEAREEGLGTSLIQRAQDEAAESGKQNKALAMMMKMGFQPGQSLGSGPSDASPAVAISPSPPVQAERSRSPSASAEPSRKPLHRIEPITIKEWSGKKGIGGIKRPPSPSVLERVSKIAKQTEEMSAGNFRDRTRQEYEERQTEGRLRHSQSTCHTLDTKEGIEFNPMWLNPMSTDSFPPGLLEELHDIWTPVVPITYSQERGDSVEARLRSQMQADALQPLSDTKESVSLAQEPKHWRRETLAEVTEFLQMNAPDRLTSILEYLRNKYNYCFWCGSQYASAQEMIEQCPGSDEDEHD